mmetsp:Transcript_18189/g.59023  ORF Transcript_18189/g.59023 Transcript_18189/m.59023 type:complete len:97 (+) Transcript_18189:394-684(+)
MRFAETRRRRYLADWHDHDFHGQSLVENDFCGTSQLDGSSCLEAALRHPSGTITIATANLWLNVISVALPGLMGLAALKLPLKHPFGTITMYTANL